jgi:hypothetical protein
VIAGNAMLWLDCGTGMTFADGEGRAAVSVKQPTQQQSAQILSFVSSLWGADFPATLLWQRILSACAAAAAAARALPTLPIKLDSAIA